MIISIDAEKVLDKMKQLFMIKTLQKADIEGIYLNIIKAIFDKPAGHITLSGKNLSISSKIRNKIRVPTLISTVQHRFGSPSHSNQRRKINKRNPDCKRRSKTLTFAYDMILYIENPKDSTGKLLELYSNIDREYSKITGYKINMQKSLALLYNNNEKTEKEVKEKSHSPLR